MKKRLLTLLLTICIICTLLPFGVLAEEVPTSGSCGDELTWEFESGELTISGKGDVTSAPWLENYADSIKSVNVQSGVTSICDNAFSSCTKLTKVLLANGITGIGAGAFRGCSSLTAVTLPAGLVSIGDSAFSGCGSLKKINLPDSITSIGAGAFKDCAKLADVAIPKDAAGIGKDAFSGCSALTDVAFGGTEEQWNGIGYTFDNKDIRVHYNLSSLSEHYKSEATPATCTEKGFTTYSCDCGYSYKDKYVDALGHDTELKDAKKASCVVGGFSGNAVCKNCGETIEAGKNIPPLGHDFKDGKCSRCGEKSAAATETNPFADVKTGSYYFDAVFWAYYHKPQIVKGVDKTHFAPDSTCTRAQIVTFLWRANGAQKLTKFKCNFKDVDKDAYYFNAVVWAVENGITNGVDETHFAPDRICSRAEAVTFLWRAQGEPDAASTKCTFKDVSKDAFYYYPMLWAVGKQVTLGFDDAHFAPNNDCTRGQIVTFIYRAMA